MDRNVVFAFAALILAAAGCSEKRQTTSPSGRTAMMAVSLSAMAAPGQRFIAERHKFEVITSDSELQKSWESAVTFCGTIQCEVVSSSITMHNGESPPLGDMNLRVVPEDLNKLVAHIEKLGKIAQHTTEREDKTAAVIDTEARIKNLISFRDSLRAMLAKPSARVQDLVEIQKQLTDTQSELDGQAAQRKILANETEKIAVEISLRVERSTGAPGGFAQIWSALRESGAVLGESTASLITTIVAVIPWLVLIVPGIWLLAKAWRALRLRRTRTPPPPTALAR